MGFINEWVSEEDVEKYGLRERNRVFYLGDGREDWTANKERDIYLRYLRTGFGNEPSNDFYFDFYWKGLLCHIKLGHDGGGVYGGSGWSIWTLKSLDLPDELKPKRIEILGDLKLALIAERGGGVASTHTEYSADFKNFE